MYTFAISRLYDTPIDNITVAHYYPHLDKLVNIKFSEAHVLMYIRKLTQKIWEIRKKKKSDFFPQMNQYCDWCGFKSMCPKLNPATHLAEYNEAIKAKKAKKKKVPLGTRV